MKALITLHEELNLAAKYQPCPACNSDIRILSEVVRKVADNNFDKNDDIKLRELSYINEVGTIGMTISPMFVMFLRKVPKDIEKVVLEDREGNEKSLVHLIRGKSSLSTLDNNSKPIRKISKILDTFITLTDFKLSITPLQFYAFDKAIRFGYKTHMIPAAAKIISAIKLLEVGK
jgi:hypothetical protein